MLILIVDAYDEENRKSREAYELFSRTIKEALDSRDCINNVYLERRIDRLGDLTLNWYHDSIEEISKTYVKQFDKLDYVFVGGDMIICPWDPIATQVVTLVAMVHQTKKPFCGIGFGAFIAIYATATDGSRFHVMNGPNGSALQELPSFPIYSVGHGAYPSAWLDNETGDLYTYNNSKKWLPVSNIGCHYISSAGLPTIDRQRSRSKQASRDNGSLLAQKTEALDMYTDIVTVRNRHIQHPYVKGLKSSFSFAYYSDWFLNSDGALPSKHGLQVLADGTTSPALMGSEYMLLFTCRLENTMNKERSRVPTVLVKNFVAHTMAKQLLLTVKEEDNRSLFVFLFGKDGYSGGYYDSIKDDRVLSKPLASAPIPTTLPEGPIKVDSPAIGMFFRAPKLEKVSEIALTRSRKQSTVGKKHSVTVQNPLSAREKRLKQFFGKNGYGGHEQFIHSSLQDSDNTNFVENRKNAPEHASDLLAGQVINTNSISIRSNHNKELFIPVKYFQEEEDQNSQQGLLISSIPDQRGATVEAVKNGNDAYHNSEFDSISAISIDVDIDSYAHNFADNGLVSRTPTFAVSIAPKRPSTTVTNVKKSVSYNEESINQGRRQVKSANDAKQQIVDDNDVRGFTPKAQQSVLVGLASVIDASESRSVDIDKLAVSFANGENDKEDEQMPAENVDKDRIRKVLHSYRNQVGQPIGHKKNSNLAEDDSDEDDADHSSNVNEKHQVLLTFSNRRGSLSARKANEFIENSGKGSLPRKISTINTNGQPLSMQPVQPQHSRTPSSRKASPRATSVIVNQSNEGVYLPVQHPIPPASTRYDIPTKPLKEEQKYGNQYPPVSAVTVNFMNNNRSVDSESLEHSSITTDTTSSSVTSQIHTGGIYKTSPRNFLKTSEYFISPSTEIVRVEGMSPRPYNTYKKIQKLITQRVADEANCNYQGYYRDDVKNKKDSPSKHSKEPFQATFGKASALPLRKEGLVRTQGPFPDFPNFIPPSGAVAADYHLMNSQRLKKDNTTNGMAREIVVAGSNMTK